MTQVLIKHMKKGNMTIVKQTLLCRTTSKHLFRDFNFRSNKAYKSHVNFTSITTLNGCLNCYLWIGTCIHEVNQNKGMISLEFRQLRCLFHSIMSVITNLLSTMKSLYSCNGVAILQRHLLLLQIRTCLIDVCLIVLFHSDLYHDNPWY